jgi:hypothetical protein
MSAHMRKSQYLYVVFIPCPQPAKQFVDPHWNYYPHTFFDKRHAEEWVKMNPDLIGIEIVKYKKEK